MTKFVLSDIYRLGRFKKKGTNKSYNIKVGLHKPSGKSYAYYTYMQSRVFISIKDFEPVEDQAKVG